MESKIALTEKNVKKLLKHKPVQLHASQVGRGIKIHPDMPEKHKKAIHRAIRLSKGVRLQFSPQELVHGSGFF